MQKMIFAFITAAVMGLNHFMEEKLEETEML